MNKYICIAAIFALFLSACSSVPVSGRKQLNLVSDQDVLTSSFQQYDGYIKSAKLSSDKANKDRVVRVGQNIAKAVEQYLVQQGMQDQLPNYKWEFNLVADPAPNAFCMPGGKIVVYEGILPYTQDDLGLAVVMGHEVAHAVAKHSNERMSQQVATNAGSQALGLLLSGQSDQVKTIGAQVYGLGAEYGIMLPYSRKHEHEADHIGLIFMAMAGYDPNAAVGFWQRMAQAGGPKPPEFSSTHPSDEHRIEEIQKALPEAMKHYVAPAKGSKSTPAKKAPAKKAPAKK